MIRRIFSKIRKCVLPLTMIFFLVSGMTACSDTVLHEDHDQGAEGLISTPAEAIDYHLTFDGKTCLSDRGGAVAKDGDNVVIIKAGVYHLTGSYEGQLQISVADTEHVTLIMEDLSITSPDSAALYVKNAGCVYVEVPEGKSATLTDAVEYKFPVGVTKPNACIYAADDITFRGLGQLTVNGNYNNGIGCNNDVAFMSGRVTVSAKNNGVKGAGSVNLSGDAILTVLGADDAIKSDGINTGEGIIRMSDRAKVYASCSDDVLQALVEITVTDDACIYYECEGSIVNCGNAKVPESAKIPWVKE